ncbi:MAG: VWA domain-containing protein [Clostridiales bacterium]|nr:VWA domain-containing protein [Clostridiales bacterium]
MKKLCFIFIILIPFALFAGCSSYDRGYYPGYLWQVEGNTYNDIIENDFLLAEQFPKSTFSLDVNTAAYSNLRKHIVNGYPISEDQVRIEEMVNYFKYDYPEPEEGQPLSITAALFPCPWNEEAYLLQIGLKAQSVDFSATANNLVFLLDVSGSMDSPDKIGLMQQAFFLLADQLDENDVVSIVTYAGSDRVVLQGVPGSQKQTIRAAIEDLEAGGSTAGARGIQTAYSIAEEYFIEGGNNRVILATDGDFNVGISSKQGLEDLISSKRQSGIYLTVLGFGYGNLRDDKLETLANRGNGNYAYIDNLNEARKVLIEEIGGTLRTVARDAKAQVEFNPAKVYSYRLLGYENKLLTNEDWENDEKDAGEIGAGHTVTAMYEVIFANGQTEAESTMAENFLKVSVRYKDPDTSSSEVKEISRYASAADIAEQPGDDQLFISAVVEAALILRDSKYKGSAKLQNVIERLEGISSLENDPYKSEFLDLMKLLRGRGNDYF